MDSLETLEDMDGYLRLFFDTTFWSPYVRQVCQREGLSPCETIRGGIAGTCPAFIVEDRWLVKFFGRLFDGGPSFTAEQEANRLAAQDPGILPAPVISSGVLRPGEDWPWPYLIFRFIPGKSIGEQAEQVSGDDWLGIARTMGKITRRLHNLPIDGSTVFPNSYEPYLAFLAEQKARCVQNHREWGTLPAHLVDQIPGFLPPLDSLIDHTRPPHLIHADLTRDHLLGRVEDGRWQSLALIDFGDAMTGDLLYELVALHLDLFHGDQRLLKAFFEDYGLSEEKRKDLPRFAMATCLLHRFDPLSVLPRERLQVETLDQLAKKLWSY